MAARLIIQDGNPIWTSQSIVPSRDTMVSASSRPNTAAVSVGATGVFVYVKVENPAQGSSDIGVCGCSETGFWTAPVAFAGFRAGPTIPPPTGANPVVIPPPIPLGGGFSLTFSSIDVSLTGPGVSRNLGAVRPRLPSELDGRMAWSVSPDGRFFAYAISQPSNPGTMAWDAAVVALQDVTRSNGSILRRGDVAADAGGLFAAPANGINLWDGSNFGWAGSSAVLCYGRQNSFLPTTTVTPILMCPLAPATSAQAVSISAQPVAGQIDLEFRISPCEKTFAVLPKLLNSMASPRTFVFYATTTGNGSPINLRKNNQIAGTISATRPASGVGAPSIETRTQTADGVWINTGDGTFETRDDPDCTFVGGGVSVRVDRVKASTLPSANLGVLPVGVASGGSLAAGASRWVQVPNTQGWANQGEQHWCLLAQAYTADGTTIPLPWNAAAPMPPAFPAARETCAQRNIAILP